MTTTTPQGEFDRRYQTLLKHLRLQGLRPKTIEAYARGIRRMGEHFEWQIDDLSAEQLSDYFNGLLQTHSWSSLKLDLYGYKFYTEHVLGKPWVMPHLIKAPKVQRLPDIVNVAQAQRLFASTRCVSYRVFFFVLYSMGLRLGEGLRLQVGDIDAAGHRVHVRDAKGNRDRMVPLPTATLLLLRRFWRIHRNPQWLFPSRQGGAAAAGRAQGPLDPGGVQTALHRVVQQCGIKKTSPLTACATAMRPT